MKVILLCSIVLLMGCVRIRPTMLSKVKVVVVDAKSNKPVPNMVLWYRVEGSYFYTFFRIDSVSRYYFAKRYLTNEKGEIFLTRKIVWINLLLEKVTHFDFVANLDFDYEGLEGEDVFFKCCSGIWKVMGKEKEGLDFIYNKNYKVSRISASTYFRTEEELKKGSTGPNESPLFYSKDMNYNSILKENKGILIVKLYLLDKDAKLKTK